MSKRGKDDTALSTLTVFLGSIFSTTPLKKFD